jgi:hypothetical protein
MESFASVSFPGYVLAVALTHPTYGSELFFASKEAYLLALEDPKTVAMQQYRSCPEHNSFIKTLDIYSQSIFSADSISEDATATSSLSFKFTKMSTESVLPSSIPNLNIDLKNDFKPDSSGFYQETKLTDETQILLSSSDAAATSFEDNQSTSSDDNQSTSFDDNEDSPPIRPRVSKLKRAPSPYIIFCAEQRPAIKAANPHVSFFQMGRLFGDAWAKLTDAEKKVDKILC